MLTDIETHGAATIAELVARTGLHENTLRGHLRRLVADGYLVQERAARVGRGRPTHRWRPVSPEHAHPYIGLASRLATALAQTGSEARQLATAAGMEWGAQLATAHSAATHSEHEPRALVLRVMREQGFAPETPAAHADDAPILLRHCPLRTAVEHSDVVCAVHQGLITGIVRAHDPDAQATLRPFAVDGACALQLSRAA